jgi:hypothetical protein
MAMTSKSIMLKRKPKEKRMSKRTDNSENQYQYAGWLWLASIQQWRGFFNFLSVSEKLNEAIISGCVNTATANLANGYLNG